MIFILVSAKDLLWVNQNTPLFELPLHINQTNLPKPCGYECDTIYQNIFYRSSNNVRKALFGYQRMFTRGDNNFRCESDVARAMEEALQLSRNIGQVYD